MSSKIFFDFGSLELHPHFAIGEMFEGADISLEDYKGFNDAIIAHYKDRPFGYISNRTYSYSIDPSTYTLSSNIKNLVAISVVLTLPAQKLSSKIEELFFGRPFQYFDELEVAKKWMFHAVSQEASVRQ